MRAVHITSLCLAAISAGIAVPAAPQRRGSDGGGITSARKPSKRQLSHAHHSTDDGVGDVKGSNGGVIKNIVHAARRLSRKSLKALSDTGSDLDLGELRGPGAKKRTKVELHDFDGHSHVASLRRVSLRDTAGHSLGSDAEAGANESAGDLSWVEKYEERMNNKMKPGYIPRVDATTKENFEAPTADGGFYPKEKWPMDHFVSKTSVRFKFPMLGGRTLEATVATGNIGGGKPQPEFRGGDWEKTFKPFELLLGAMVLTSAYGCPVKKPTASSAPDSKPAANDTAFGLGKAAKNWGMEEKYKRYAKNDHFNAYDEKHCNPMTRTIQFGTNTFQVPDYPKEILGDLGEPEKPNFPSVAPLTDDAQQLWKLSMRVIFKEELEGKSDRFSNAESCLKARLLFPYFEAGFMKLVALRKDKDKIVDMLELYLRDIRGSEKDLVELKGQLGEEAPKTVREMSTDSFCKVQGAGLRAQIFEDKFVDDNGAPVMTKPKKAGEVPVVQPQLKFASMALWDLYILEAFYQWQEVATAEGSHKALTTMDEKKTTEAIARVARHFVRSTDFFFAQEAPARICHTGEFPSSEKFCGTGTDAAIFVHHRLKPRRLGYEHVNRPKQNIYTDLVTRVYERLVDDVLDSYNGYMRFMKNPDKIDKQFLRPPKVEVAVFSVEIGGGQRVRVLLVSGHPDSDGNHNVLLLAMAKEMFEDQQDDWDLKYVIVGMDANVQIEDDKKGYTWPEFEQRADRMKFAVLTPKDDTVNKQRTFLQAQLKKAGKLDQVIKDVVCIYPGYKVYRIENVVRQFWRNDVVKHYRVQWNAPAVINELEDPKAEKTCCVRHSKLKGETVPSLGFKEPKGDPKLCNYTEEEGSDKPEDWKSLTFVKDVSCSVKDFMAQTTDGELKEYIKLRMAGELDSQQTYLTAIRKNEEAEATLKNRCQWVAVNEPKSKIKNLATDTKSKLYNDLYQMRISMQLQDRQLYDQIIEPTGEENNEKYAFDWCSFRTNFGFDVASNDYFMKQTEMYRVKMEQKREDWIAYDAKFFQPLGRNDLRTLGRRRLAKLAKEDGRFPIKSLPSDHLPVFIRLGLKDTSTLAKDYGRNVSTPSTYPRAVRLGTYNILSQTKSSRSAASFPGFPEDAWNIHNGFLAHRDEKNKLDQGAKNTWIAPQLDVMEPLWDFIVLQEVDQPMWNGLMELDEAKYAFEFLQECGYGVREENEKKLKGGWKWGTPKTGPGKDAPVVVWKRAVFRDVICSKVGVKGNIGYCQLTFLGGGVINVLAMHADGDIGFTTTEAEIIRQEQLHKDQQIHVVLGDINLHDMDLVQQSMSTLSENLTVPVHEGLSVYRFIHPYRKLIQNLQNSNSYDFFCNAGASSGEKRSLQCPVPPEAKPDGAGAAKTETMNDWIKKAYSNEMQGMSSGDLGLFAKFEDVCKSVDEIERLEGPSGVMCDFVELTSVDEPVGKAEDDLSPVGEDLKAMRDAMDKYAKLKDTRKQSELDDLVKSARVDEERFTRMVLTSGTYYTYDWCEFKKDFGFTANDAEIEDAQRMKTESMREEWGAYDEDMFESGEVYIPEDLAKGAGPSKGCPDYHLPVFMDLKRKKAEDKSKTGKRAWTEVKLGTFDILSHTKCVNTAKMNMGMDEGKNKNHNELVDSTHALNSTAENKWLPGKLDKLKEHFDLIVLQEVDLPMFHALQNHLPDTFGYGMLEKCVGNQRKEPEKDEELMDKWLGGGAPEVAGDIPFIVFKRTVFSSVTCKKVGYKSKVGLCRASFKKRKGGESYINILAMQGDAKKGFSIQEAGFVRTQLGPMVKIHAVIGSVNLWSRTGVEQSMKALSPEHKLIVPKGQEQVPSVYRHRYPYRELVRTLQTAKFFKNVCVSGDTETKLQMLCPLRGAKYIPTDAAAGPGGAQKEMYQCDEKDPSGTPGKCRIEGITLLEGEPARMFYDLCTSVSKLAGGNESKALVKAFLGNKIKAAFMARKKPTVTAPAAKPTIPEEEVPAAEMGQEEKPDAKQVETRAPETRIKKTEEVPKKNAPAAPPATVQGTTAPNIDGDGDGDRGDLWRSATSAARTVKRMLKPVRGLLRGAMRAFRGTHRR